ncbi:TetR/AcrR family transcriptional regulator [Actinomadura macrotermitis]|uniref:HTH tetR-type domain-containing protein n=1 Tax=Actinomadura macrotermitis TaxID=2585200 RepID=A0A7K0C506_9ACTN|nr:TetR/AcrR family transcriptional regulator [Actinomadura macrotermitis]MQY08523.1 hypothetical protein [Actinomadura macrotermitis]
MEQRDRPMRADARRNRAKILAAAEAVFTAKGPAASTEEIAERAGVAIGTVFRHFPVKEALVQAVVAERLRRLAEAGRAAAGEPDPGAAFYAFIAHCVGEAATKHSFADALPTAGMDPSAVHDAVLGGVAELDEAVGALLARAQRAGAVRADLTVPEVAAVVTGAARAAEFCGPDGRLRARVLGVIFDGLRPLASAP